MGWRDFVSWWGAQFINRLENVMLERFLKQTQFESLEDFNNNFEIKAHPFKEPIPEYIRELHNVSRQTTKTKSIPYKDIKPNYVYEDVKGHQWVYLGEGYLFEESTIYRDGISRRNRQGCYLVYLDFDRIKNYNTILENGTLEVNGELHSLILDTYCSKKRFIKQVKKLGEGNILKVQGKHGKYLFRPI